MRKWNLIWFLSYFYFIFFVHELQAQSGIIDESFGDRGKLITDFNKQTDVIDDVLFLKDGSFVQYGRSYKGSLDYIAITKNTNLGNLDLSFGINGKVLIRAEVYDIKLLELNDGKIQIIGLKWQDSTYSLVFMRINSDGSMDSNYSDDGVMIIDNFFESGDIIGFSLNQLESNTSQYFFYTKRQVKNAQGINQVIKLIDLNGSIIKAVPIMSEMSLPEINGEFLYLYKNNIYKAISSGNNSIIVKQYDLAGKLNDNFGSDSKLKISIPIVAGSFFQIHHYSWILNSESNLILVIHGVEVKNQGNIVKTYMIKFDNNGYLDKKFGSEGIVEIDSDARDIFYREPMVVFDSEKILVSISKVIQPSIVFSELKYFDKNGKLDESFPLKGTYPPKYLLGDSSYYSPGVLKIVNDQLYIGLRLFSNENSYDFFLSRFNLKLPSNTSMNFSPQAKLFILKNPITEELNLRFKGEVLDEDSQLQILDMNANILHTEKIRAIDFNSELKVDLSFIPSGHYIVCLRNSKGSYHNKFIKL